MENSKRFAHLLNVDIFHDLPADFRKGFLDSCSCHFYETPTIVLMQGEPSPGLYLVAHGGLDIVYLGAEGQRTFLMFGDVGRSVGETECISGHACAATCETQPNTTLLFCPEPQLLGHLSNLRFVRNLMAAIQGKLLLGNYLRHIDLNVTTDKRLCGYLLTLSRDGTKIHNTQSALAGILGCSRQSINRELGKLRDRGLVSVEKGVIEILDREKMQQFVDH